MNTAREPEKLAAIEKQIEEVKQSGYGTITITVRNGQITDSTFTIGAHWDLISQVELDKKEKLLTVFVPVL